MNKIMLILSIFLGIIFVLMVILMFFIKYTASPNIISFRNISVDDETITLSGDFTGSAVWYAGYETDYKNGSLDIKVKAVNIKFPGASGDFEIKIPNKYETVNEIYIKGEKNDQVIKIWPENIK